MTWDKIKNFVIGGGLVLVWAITLGFLDWRASVHADTAVAAKIAQISTNTTIVEMDKTIDANTLNITNNASDIEFTQEQLRDIAQILMQPPADP